MAQSYIELKCKECGETLDVDVRMNEVEVYPCVCVKDKADKDIEDAREEGYESGYESAQTERDEQSYEEGYEDARRKYEKEDKDANVE